MRKILWPTLALCVVTALLQAADPPVDKDVLEKHAKALRAALPDGWDVHAESDGKGIKIERKLMAIVNDNSPSQPRRMPGDAPKKASLFLALHAGPPTSQAQLDAMIKQNADRETALDMLRAQMTDMLPTTRVKPSGGDAEDYVAKTPDQQARLNAFVAVKHAIPTVLIPDLFAADASFVVITQDWWLTPAEEPVQNEVADIREKVAKCFTTKPLK